MCTKTYSFASPAFLTADEMALTAAWIVEMRTVKSPLASGANCRCSARTKRVKVMQLTSIACPLDVISLLELGLHLI